MFYETAGNAHGLPHDPFKALVSPRPIGWISTRSVSGAVNLAPYSFFNAISDDPKLVMFSSSDGHKDSSTFATESGEFAVNLVTEDLVAAMNRSSASAPRGTSEFALAGLTEAPSRLIAAPHVGEALAVLECRVTESFSPKRLDGSLSSSVIVIGQVVGIHIDESVLRKGRVAMDLYRPVSRLGYRDYATIIETFELNRPRKPDGSDV
ncbi:flavin reductase family protein [Aureimonas mangrovi]|uniref:flavin reductase family protein n=1 Tax=Aureimonas mangrovi TaxID=2758041 RepID=UPI00163D409D|nr:flavin reductase family protein [Aureimonas mangrovi]